MRETLKKEKKVVRGAAPLNDANLAESLPDGEVLIWQGRSEAHAIAIRGMYLWYVVAYLLGLVVLRTGYLILGDASISEWSALLAWQLLASLFIVGVIVGLSVLYAKTTIYSLTNRRLILRTGAAVPIHVNFPLEQIASADLKVFSDGTGDIALRLENSDKLYWLLLWPNVRSWWIRPLQPLLRGLRDFELAASALAGAASAESAVSLGQFKREYQDVSVVGLAPQRAQ